MEEMQEKSKKIIRIVGVTGAVYAGIRYFLPLVLPFLLAAGAAAVLRPSVLWLRKKLTLKNGRSLPPGIFGAVELCLIFAAFLLILFPLLRFLMKEVAELGKAYPQWSEKWYLLFYHSVSSMERYFHLPEGVLSHGVEEAAIRITEALKEKMMPFLLENSMTLGKGIAEVFVFFLLFFMGTILTLNEYDEMKKEQSNSLFCRELHVLGRRLFTTTAAWLRTQIFIMTGTSILCTIGFFLAGNPYAAILGILTGFLDVLPFLGTGIILLPYSLIMLFQKKFKKSLLLSGLYLVCYFFREFTEAGKMAEEVGLSPLKTMVSIYAGMRLFGISGLFLGPMAFLMIRDLLKLYGGKD